MKKGESYLEQFSEQVSFYHDLMSEAFEGVINEGVSKYPVFIFHQQEVTVGLPIADRHVIVGDWSVNISTLEEFYIKGLVTIEQVEEIKSKINGKPSMFCCLVLSGDKASLVFLQRT
ncbi:MAG TPA: hypothetical protein VMZ69_04680 [Saprospiraceae bacterium]|nr:hypothetical protein [Saprospiraceae bacterium]